MTMAILWRRRLTQGRHQPVVDEDNGGNDYSHCEEAEGEEDYDEDEGKCDDRDDSEEDDENQRNDNDDKIHHPSYTVLEEIK